jgi:hypothetical protein
LLTQKGIHLSFQKEFVDASRHPSFFKFDALCTSFCLRQKVLDLFLEKVTLKRFVLKKQEYLKW